MSELRVKSITIIEFQSLLVLVSDESIEPKTLVKLKDIMT